jgi:SAM-dependent methyltransferase
VVEEQLGRLCRLLPPTPARLVDAACGPGLYALPLARHGYDVTGVDVSPAALRHARQASRELPYRSRLHFRRGDLRTLSPPRVPFDAAILIYFVLEAFPRREQPLVLRRIAASLQPGGTAVVEMRLRPDQYPGRLDWWDVSAQSVLSDRRHLLLGDTTYDRRRNTYVLREIAVFDDGRVAVQQTSAWMCPFDGIPRLFARGGFAVTRIYDGWSNTVGTQLSETVLVVATQDL